MSLHLLRLPMATLLLLLLLSLSASARPCRTFLISSYSFRNPSSHHTFATITQIRPLPLPTQNDDVFFLLPFPSHHHHDNPRASLPRAPLGYDFASLRDRTKDILSVVLALLFGIGCGALTAAAMYLLWSLFSARHHLRYDGFEFSDDDEQILSPKKVGYVTVPAKEEPAKDSV